MIPMESIEIEDDNKRNNKTNNNKEDNKIDNISDNKSKGNIDIVSNNSLSKNVINSDEI